MSEVSVSISLMENGTYLRTHDGFELINATAGYWVAFEETTLEATIPGETIGVWTDSQTGKVWIDKSMHLNDLNKAILFGQMFDQKAIYDILNQKEIRIGND